MSSTDKKPKVHHVASTSLNRQGIITYLKSSGNEAFIETMDAHPSDMEVLVSMMAKLCYKSLSLGHNDNISRIRDIKSNIEAAINSEHGSVLEHASMSFIVEDCSRIFTHELVRHRTGTAFSQNSGRYIRLNDIDVVLDPLLEPVEPEVAELCRTIEACYAKMAEKLQLNAEGLTFGVKKKITSALRRIAPNGQTNEIGFTINLRAMRFIIEKRTSHAAEWEIRYVFAQVYFIARSLVPTLFCDAVVNTVDGLPEVKFGNRT